MSDPLFTDPEMVERPRVRRWRFRILHNLFHGLGKRGLKKLQRESEQRKAADP